MRTLRPLGRLSLVGVSLALATAMFAGCSADDDPAGIDLPPSAADDSAAAPEKAPKKKADEAPSANTDSGPPVEEPEAPPPVFGPGTTLRTTDPLNLRTGPGTQHGVIVTMPEGAVVAVVGDAPENDFYNIRYASLTGWASGQYLVPAPGAKVDDFPLQKIITPVPVRPHVQAFANASCAVVGCPDVVSSYHGHQPSVDRALDVFQLRARGDQYADYGVADKVHRVDYVIWRQRINTRDGRGWRMMEDRGSITANHYDHVHVSFGP